MGQKINFEKNNRQNFLVMGVVYNKMSTSTSCTTTSTSSSLDSDVEEIQESHDEASESILDKLRTPITYSLAGHTLRIERKGLVYM